MDIEELSQFNKEGGPVRKLDSSYIRTMEKDLAALRGKSPGRSVSPVSSSIKQEPVSKAVPSGATAGLSRKAAPPAGLPIIESIKKPEPSLKPLSVPRPAESVSPLGSLERMKKLERMKEEEEIKKRIEETRKRIEEDRRKAEMARQKAIREEEKRREEEKKKEKIKEEAERRQRPEIERKKKPLLKFVFIGLAVIIVIGGFGGFIYWWNYLRIVEVVEPVFHYECQDNLCQQVPGEGEDQCRTDADCQPVEPTEPTSLIPVAETETIELAVGQEDLLIEELKTAASQEQATSTFKRILVKIVSQTEKRYADLNTLLTALGISLPNNILTAVAASEPEGGNYTLFLYNQATGNRLGLIIEMTQSETLVADLKNWEIIMAEDLKQLFLKDEVPAAFTEEFQDNTYQEVAIRYLNFPDPDLSIDYSLVNSKLVLTTSRASMYAAIDALLATGSELEPRLNEIELPLKK